MTYISSLKTKFTKKPKKTTTIMVSKKKPFSFLKKFLPPKLPKITGKNVKTTVALILTLSALGISSLLVRQRQDLSTRADALDVTLSLLPSNSTFSPGEEFSVNVIMDTSQSSVSAVEIHLSFDSEFLTATDFEILSDMPIILSAPTTAPGTADVVLGSSPEAPVQGIKTIARLTLIAGTTPGTTQIAFSPTTAAAAIDHPDNVVLSLNPTSITILGPSPTPTPTPSPTSEPISSPSPSPEPSNSEPIITTKNLRKAQINKSYSMKITATDTDLGDTLTMTASGLPPGFSLTACETSTNTRRKREAITCTLIGTTTSKGTFNVTITANDGQVNTVKVFPFQVR